MIDIEVNPMIRQTSAAEERRNFHTIRLVIFLLERSVMFIFVKRFSVNVSACFEPKLTVKLSFSPFRKNENVAKAKRKRYDKVKQKISKKFMLMQDSDSHLISIAHSFKYLACFDIGFIEIRGTNHKLRSGGVIYICQ